MQVQKAIANLSADDYETLLIHTEMDTGIVVAEQPLAFVKAIKVCVLCPVCVCVCVCARARLRTVPSPQPSLGREHCLPMTKSRACVCVCMYSHTHTES